MNLIYFIYKDLNVFGIEKYTYIGVLFSIYFIYIMFVICETMIVKIIKAHMNK
jgi:hypothetical protein